MATGGAIAASTASATTQPAPVGARIPVARTIVRRRSLAGQLRVPKLDARATHRAGRWRGGDAQIRLHNETGWTGWQPLDECGGAPDNHPNPGHSALLVAPGTTGYEIVVSGGGTAEVSEINTIDGPALVAAAPAVVGMPMPDGSTCPVTYLSRAAWGADESKRFDSGGNEVWPAEWWPAQVLTVHHTAGINNDPDPAATVRAIYQNQAVTQGWGDIGYHLLVDEAGRVYEGRWTGGGNWPIFGTSAAQMNTAGHAEGYNTGNIGVVLLGDFTNQGPTSAAVNALTTVLASLARMLNIDPQATVNYFNPVNNNAKANLGLTGHRDWNATQCPGNTFYPTFDSLRANVAAQIPPVERTRPGQPPVEPPTETRSPAPSSSPHLPGGDGRTRPPG